MRLRRRLLLVLHLVASMGWVGAALAYLGLGVTAVTTTDVETDRSAWVAMELVGWSVIVPLALSALVTGVLIAVVGGWGLVRRGWVLASLVLTALAATITVAHMPMVSAEADLARRADATELAGLGGDLFHPSAGLVVLLVVTVLNVVKPRGRRRAGTPAMPERARWRR